MSLQRYEEIFVRYPLLSKEREQALACQMEEAEMRFWAASLRMSKFVPRVLTRLKVAAEKAQGCRSSHDPKGVKRRAASDILRLIRYLEASHDARSREDLYRKIGRAVRRIDPSRKLMGHALQAFVRSQRKAKVRVVLQELRAYAEEWRRARSHLLFSNFRIVSQVAGMYSRGSLPSADRIQEAYLGLEHAINRFDYRRGGFANFVFPLMRKRVIRALFKTSFFHFGVNQPSRMSRVARIIETYLHTHGREPTDDELALQSGLPKKAAAYTRKLVAMSEPASLDARYAAHHGDGYGCTSVSVSYFLASSDPSPEEQATESERTRFVERLLNSLPPNRREIIRMLYGIGCPEYSHKEIGTLRGGISKQAIQQAEARTLASLRELAAPVAEEYL